MTYGTLQHEPPVFTFRVEVRDANQPTNAWRDITIAGDQTLEQLGRYIIDAFDFDNEHLSSFFMSGKEWDTDSEYKMQANLDPRGEAELEGIAPRTLGLVRDRRPPASEVLMRDLPLPGKAGEQEFLFLYDYGDEWTFTVRLLEWNETIDPHAIYPRIVASLGEPPDQYPYVPDPWGGDDDMDDESGGNVLLNFPAPKPVSDR